MQHPRRRPALTRYHVLFLSLVACSNFEPGAILGQLDGGAGVGVAGFSFNGGAQSGQGGRSESSTPNASGLRPSVTKDPDDQGSDSTSAGGADGGNAGDESSGATRGAGGSGGDVAGSGVGGVAPDGTGASGGVSGLGGASAAGGSGRAGSAGSGARSGSGGSGASGGRGGTASSGGHAGSGAGTSSSGGSGAAGGAAGHGSSGAAGGPPPPRDLILSEYVEGSASFKAIEIRSETATRLDGCQLATYFNGNTTTTKPLALDGAVAAGDVYVLCTEELAAALGSVCDRATNLSFNGNDAVALECEGAILDVLGQIGFDPKDAWGSADASTLNHTLRRRCDSPAEPDGSDAFDPAIAWLALPTDTFDGLGDPACE